jgi:hypothetical protein
MNPLDKPDGITAARPHDRPRAGEPTIELATLTPVPEPFRQRVRGPGYRLKVNLLELHPVLFFFGGVALLIGGGWLATTDNWAIGCANIALGVPAVIWGAYVALCCSTVTSNRWIERRLRYEIGQRADSLVEAHDPESIYVSLIPREHFSQIRWTYASDLLLLKIDAPRRRVLLEGDSDRYVIPAEAIARCDLQPMTIVVDQSKQFWMVRLLVDFEDETRELLLSSNHTRWSPSTNEKRRAVADGIRRQNKALMG